MSVKDYVLALKNTVIRLRNEGVKEVPCDGLLSCLDDMLKEPPEKASDVTLEKYRAELQHWVEQHKALEAFNIEMFRAVVAYGQSALKSAMLINGGAGVALLAFIGHVWEKDLAPEIVRGLTWSLFLFISGVLASAVAAGTTYLSQHFWASDWQRTGHAINYITIVLVGMSYLAFAIGGYEAYSAFRAHLTD
jgi:hypothetical protein